MIKQDTERSWHRMPAEATAMDLESDLSHGLAEDEVLRRLETYGPNTLTSQKSQGPVVRFLMQFNQPLVIILDRKSTRLNSSPVSTSRMPSSA